MVLLETSSLKYQQHPCLVKGIVVWVLNTAQDWMSSGQGSQTKKLRAVTCVALPPQLLPKKCGRRWDGNVRKTPYRRRAIALSKGRRTLPTAQVLSTMATEFDLGSVVEWVSKDRERGFPGHPPTRRTNPFTHRTGPDSAQQLSIQMSEPPNGIQVHGQRAYKQWAKGQGRRAREKGRQKAS